MYVHLFKGNREVLSSRGATFDHAYLGRKRQNQNSYTHVPTDRWSLDSNKHGDGQIPIFLALVKLKLYLSKSLVPGHVLLNCFFRKKDTLKPGSHSHVLDGWPLVFFTFGAREY